ncbi:MAG TPA: hypothetical protein VN231_14595 [Allosphingosinicella sp.]|nr:hypothetical protein [Allosphingosinicella sp.]
MKLLALALATPLVLVGAAYPDDAKLAPEGYEGAEQATAPITYRPCRPGRGDDRCIQLYERGVRASYARWLRDRGVAEPRTQVAAVGGPIEDRAHHPRRRHAGSDEGHRCHEADSREGDARGM